MNAPYCQHVHINCRELKPMVEFWIKGLGARLEEYRKFGVLDGAALDFNSGQTKLYLREQPCERQDQAAPRSGVDHVGMMVPDLDKALADLTALPGVTLAREPFMSKDLRCAFINGPEGISIELMQKTT
ncbi:MAG: VOC family protein [Deltaproteobacteria bacterium]|jgi:catechol 2,3-dioxygenase-like lactoylglutathione lyase family enzyme|nr:VOC family protein [Deltaproteobacteria bacterium]